MSLRSLEMELLSKRLCIWKEENIIIGNSFKTEFRYRIEAYDEYQGVKYKSEIIVDSNIIFNVAWIYW